MSKYEAELKRIVELWQTSHGLKVDGVMGKLTAESVNSYDGLTFAPVVVSYPAKKEYKDYVCVVHLDGEKICMRISVSEDKGESK